MMRPYADHFVGKIASLASPGVDESRLGPPGPARSQALDAYDDPGALVSRSPPDRGIVHTAVEVPNQRGEALLTMTAITILLRHAPQR
jgi:hypothetical protein